jgi:hypothetical protein
MEHFSTAGSAMGLLLAPFLALAHLTVGYALVQPACARHSVWMLHGVAIAFLGAALLATYVAWRDIRLYPAAGDTAPRAHFFGWLGTFTGILFSAVIIAQWLTVWVLSPCVR